MNLAATETDLIESYALRLDDPMARELVGRWYDATRALRTYIEERRAEPLDLGDVATLAEMFVDATARGGCYAAPPDPIEAT